MTGRFEHVTDPAPPTELQEPKWWAYIYTAAVQAIWCHDITVAWVPIPAREEPKICEIELTPILIDSDCYVNL